MLALLYNPSKTSEEKMDLKRLFLFYYKLVIIVIVSYFVVNYALSFVSRAAPIQLDWTFLGIQLVFTPIQIIIGAFVVNLIGKRILKSFNGSYVNTLTALVYAQVVWTFTFWIFDAIPTLIWSYGPLNSINNTTDALSLLLLEFWGPRSFSYTLSTTHNLFAILIAACAVVLFWYLWLVTIALAKQQKCSKTSAFVAYAIGSLIPVIIFFSIYHVAI
jgi:hypothetical protein